MLAKKILTAIIFLSTSAILFSQSQQPQNFCGYTGKSEWLTQYQKNKSNYPQRKGGSITYLPMKVHLVGNDNGNGHFSEKQAYDAFCQLNSDYEPAEIQFYLVGEFNYINNSDWYEHDFRDGRAMMNQNNVANVINTYFVQDPAGNCGYYTGGADALAVAKSCAGASDHTWAHEVGHYLSLPHPFYGWEGIDVVGTEPAPNEYWVEKVDGSNCQSAGDGFCDTKPDYISNRWSCNQDGLSQTLTDPLGETFRVDGTLFMSYSNDQCANRFSDDQIAAMYANITEERPNLLRSNLVPPGEIDVTNGISLIAPEKGAILPPGTVQLAWEPIANAERYLVEVSVLPGMNIIIEREFVTGTEFVLNDLEFLDRPYYWRVRPLNPFETCVEYSNINNFVISEATGVRGISALETMVIAPNPAQSGQSLSIQMNSKKAFDAVSSVIDLNGKVLKTTRTQVMSGFQTFGFDLPDLAQGVYMLVLQNEQGEKIVRRIIIQ